MRILQQHLMVGKNKILILIISLAIISCKNEIVNNDDKKIINEKPLNNCYRNFDLFSFKGSGEIYDRKDFPYFETFNYKDSLSLIIHRYYNSHDTLNFIREGNYFYQIFNYEDQGSDYYIMDKYTKDTIYSLLVKRDFNQVSIQDLTFEIKNGKNSIRRFIKYFEGSESIIMNKISINEFDRLIEYSKKNKIRSIRDISFNFSNDFCFENIKHGYADNTMQHFNGYEVFFKDSVCRRAFIDEYLWIYLNPDYKIINCD